MEIAEKLHQYVGREVGVTDWFEITQERVNEFADATDDHQWIHVDPEAAAKGPFGKTIAHGFLSLSLTVRISSEVPLNVGQPKMAINYGLEKVRFPAPLPVGSRIRGRVKLANVSEVSGGIQVNRIVTVEVEGGEKPVMVAETVSRYYY